MLNKSILNVKGMHCASCVLTVEKAIKKVKNVKTANVNLATEKATIEHDGNLDFNLVKKEVQKSGYDVMLPTQKFEHHDHTAMLKEKEIKDLKNKFFLGAILSVLILIGTYQDYLGLDFISKQSH